MNYTEDTLVQKTMADYLEQQLGWESVYAYNREDFGPDGLLGRASDHEVVLTRTLREKLVEFNPGLPDEAYDDAVRKIAAPTASQDVVPANKEKYALIRDGVQVSFRNDKDESVRERLRVFDFDAPENNRFLCVRELWVSGDLYRRRLDVVGFVNGLPLLFVELKNIHRNLRTAFEKNYSDYRDTIPHLFHYNAIIMFGNGDKAKIGSITSEWGHFHEWKRLAEGDEGRVDMETLLKGVCDKRNFMDLFENFILFDDSTGKTRKILARNHQFLGVNRAIEAVRERKARKGRLGVFWHTQGAGKSYSMVMFTRKVRRRLGGNFTFLVLTDRLDLDVQIYKTFAGCDVTNESDDCRAASSTHLKRLLGEHKSHVFSLIQKFNQEIGPGEAYSDRDDVIVITDEAHRTQYGDLARNMHDALPNASYIGFTGTPLFKDDEITRRVFGEYVSTYDFQRAVDDGATVPLYYDARGDKLDIAVGDLNERIANKLEEFGDLETEDIDVKERLEQDLRRDYHVMTAGERLDQVARDFVEHYSTAWESGKAMLVCIDKVTCVRMYDLIDRHWCERIGELEAAEKRCVDEQEAVQIQNQIDWMKETSMAVVISEGQGEVEAFRKWDIDIEPHRRLIKDGVNLPESMRGRPEFQGKVSMPLDEAFKHQDHPFRIAVVCAMWLTGFDVPSLSTLYLDKPLKAHTLMQAIARANRVNEGKTNGLIVDYCGILQHLRHALATFVDRELGEGGEGGGGGPTEPIEKLLEKLAQAIALVRAFLEERQTSLDDVIGQEGFDLNAAIVACKEAVNESHETRKRFEVMCREVFNCYKACINIKGVEEYRAEHKAIGIIYKSLQQDRERADISDVIRALHGVVDEAIVAQPPDGEVGDTKLYDISHVNAKKLKEEFEKSTARRTATQTLMHIVEHRLRRLLEQNPMRTNFQTHYEKLVEEYNHNKDQATIERVFEELIKLADELDEEASRAVREGLDEEQLAIFDLLRKPDLSKAEIKRIKNVSVDLLKTLKTRSLCAYQWTEKQSTSDGVRTDIERFLFNDKSGLSADFYTEEEVRKISEEVFRHVRRAYPKLPSPVYAEATTH